MLTTTAIDHVEEPFTIHLAHGLLTPQQADALYATAPLLNAEQIAQVDPNHEKQYRMNLVYLVRDGESSDAATALSPEWAELLRDLRSEQFMDWLEAGTGLQLRGLPLDIGVYTHVDGDFISCHKDKPNKAITAILYLNSDWPAGSGGEYEVRVSGDPSVEPVRRIAPRAGQFLAFPPGDQSWHSVSRVDTGGAVIRLTVQLEFWFEDWQTRYRRRPAETEITSKVVN
ncbi:2OG-Fe(II) oxygenase [Actinocrinis sp.]|uniref:2OG-Fe(II) oxygenase n=1 Tax=Actinocrinis sp. TaxID=1920516 RepID=UPI002C37BD49|nr:2OG-Fe(II) oxygenase [Actinocrinis sp.]HXR72529.1 2OG-Fe(II) oxygenase [Actinocrinis sp.]